MNKLSDFRNRRTLSQHTDEEIELILTGGAAYDEDLADIASFLANFRDEAVTAPTPAEVDRFARRAASIARSAVVPTRTATRPGRNRLSPTTLRARSATAVATAALAVFSALGLTANAAVPGDFLYGLDLAMEKVGIGNGSLQERVGEARVLSDRDDHAGAIELLSRSISENPDASPEDLSTAVDVLFQLNAVHGNSENNNAGGNPENNASENSENNNAGGNSDNNASENSNAGGNSENNAGGNSENNASENSNAGGNSENNAGGNSENNASGNSDNNASENSNAGGNSENSAGGNSDNNASENSNAGGISTNTKDKSGS